jgi:hypothetical protein
MRIDGKSMTTEPFPAARAIMAVSAFAEDRSKVIARPQTGRSHRSLPSDKSIAAPNHWFFLQSTAVLRIGATPVAEFLFAFGEKRDATRTSDASRAVVELLA